MQVHAVLHAQPVQGGAHGLGEAAGTQLVDDILGGKGRAQAEAQLFQEGFEELRPGLHGEGITGIGADALFAGLEHPAAEKDHLQAGCQVDAATAGREGVPVGHPDFGAARCRVIEGLVHARALGDEQGDDLLVIEELGVPRAVFHRGGHIPEEAFRAPAVQSGRQIGIMQGEFPLGPQDEVAQVIGGVLAVHGLAADGHGFPVGIALGEGVPLGHDVHLHELGHARPQAFQQFHGPVGRDGAPVEVGLVQGPEILVHAPVGDGRARALLETGEELDEPLALDRFVEGTGGIGGNAPACFRDEGQLLLALGIRCFGGHLFGQVGMAGGPEHDGVTDDGDSFVERTQLVGVPGVVGIQSGQFVFRFLADVHETAPDGTAVVMHPLQGRAERGGLVDDIAGGDARLVSE